MSLFFRTVKSPTLVLTTLFPLTFFDFPGTLLMFRRVTTHLIYTNWLRATHRTWMTLVHEPVTRGLSTRSSVSVPRWRHLTTNLFPLNRYFFVSSVVVPPVGCTQRTKGVSLLATSLVVLRVCASLSGRVRGHTFVVGHNLVVFLEFGGHGLLSKNRHAKVKSTR